ncbi:MAG: hypothetical protein KKH29_05030 [Candidatus Omnitrophica bacterium]|nr:hypothetical protein [Candidatus Omnitrophota bacterium]MBU4473007.1 hypothetical protein [Candidatus Omnitrophota bacterium]MCG2706823.1 hypothetical protein [Candidatus Omnitrophota bacterium]
MICILVATGFAQDTDLEFTLDVTSSTIPLPKIFRPYIDLSGRGYHHQLNWPQVLAAGEVLDIWQKEIGFSGMYRLQYNLWEISELAKDKDLQSGLLNNYENLIRKVTEAGGIVILDIFSTPAGLGKVLDKKSVPVDLVAFKELIKSHIRNLSCNKRYNIWYEVWSAPDLDDFFLGRKQEYLNLYQAVAQAIEELKAETKIYIPVGGPGVSWWFQNLDGNTIVTPERSLIYELIKFCAHYKLPLDFITWHAYSTDPRTEKETTIYNNAAVGLIRDWLSYFRFDSNIPLIVDEWNYDRQANVLSERYDKSHICASYIPARLRHMYEAGLTYQLYFCLEDFQNNKEGVVRNVGIFWHDAESSQYKGGSKSIYNVFRMLGNLGNNMFVLPKQNDEFVGMVATKDKDYITMLIYNYIDPEIARNYISRNIASLNDRERRALLGLIKSDRLTEIMARQLDISTLRTSHKVKTLLKKVQELNDRAQNSGSTNRNIKINIKNLKGDYSYQRYAIDSSCNLNCQFMPIEEKEVSASGPYQEILKLEPYSVNMIILKKKPKEPESPPATVSPSTEPNQNITGHPD